MTESKNWQVSQNGPTEITAELDDLRFIFFKIFQNNKSSASIQYNLFKILAIYLTGQQRLSIDCYTISLLKEDHVDCLRRKGSFRRNINCFQILKQLLKVFGIWYLVFGIWYLVAVTVSITWAR